MFCRGIVIFAIIGSVMANHCANGTGTDGKCNGWEDYTNATQAARFCQPGYYGKDCDTKCSLNKCGKDDDGNMYCSVDGNCPDYDLYTGDAAAKHCQPGYYGKDCYNQCSLNKCSSTSCSSDGNCPDYSSFKPTDAAVFCQPGYYGKDCYSSCSLNHCNSTYCSVDGNCPDYNLYTGDVPADLCLNGYYGKDCYSSCVLNHCAGGQCSFDGNCPHYTTYSTDMAAKLCEKSYYGKDCYRSCRLNECSYGECSFDGKCPGWSRTNWDLCLAKAYCTDCYCFDPSSSGCALDVSGKCTTGPPSSVKGVLVSEIGNHPIGQATVEIKNIFDRNNVTKTRTASDGTFHFTVNAGSWFLTAYTGENVLTRDLFMKESVDIGTWSVSVTATVEITGYIKDAVNGKPIANATINSGAYTNYSQNDGSYSVLAVPGDVTLNITKEGFMIDEVKLKNVTTNTRADPAISPKLNPQQFRVVLSWGRTPLDLDLHMMGYSPTNTPLCQVIYSHKTCNYPGASANLDIDARRGFGPETITLEAKNPVNAQYFRIFIINYSGSPSIMESNARVTVYDQNGILGSFAVAQSKSQDSTRWDVAELSLRSDGSAVIFPL